jgi:hypothetical protein
MGAEAETAGAATAVHTAGLAAMKSRCRCRCSRAAAATTTTTTSAAARAAAARGERGLQAGPNQEAAEGSHGPGCALREETLVTLPCLQGLGVVVAEGGCAGRDCSFGSGWHLAFD